MRATLVVWVYANVYTPTTDLPQRWRMTHEDVDKEDGSRCKKIFLLIQLRGYVISKVFTNEMPSF